MPSAWSAPAATGVNSRSATSSRTTSGLFLRCSHNPRSCANNTDMTWLCEWCSLRLRVSTTSASTSRNTGISIPSSPTLTMLHGCTRVPIDSATPSAACAALPAIS